MTTTVNTSVPCQTCPWRRTSTVGGADIPNFDLDLMRGLRSTVGPGDGFRRVMACHYSECGDETVCVGYVAREGWQNLNVRILAMQGHLDIEAILDACESLDLWSDFETMLAAYEGNR